MSSALDPHGQPLNHAFNLKQRLERDVAELLGIVKGLLADGRIVDEEIHYLQAWSQNHPEALIKWPVSLLFSRIQQILSDGHIDDAEREEMRDTLASLVGGTAAIQLGYEGASTLPLDSPPPSVCWQNEVYVFTGKFAYGTRDHCEQEVLTRGGHVEGNVTRRTSFLVIGTFGSRDWKQTPYGRKIERAAELRNSGTGLRIIGEDHWATALVGAQAF